MKLSIIIPTYNESDNIGCLVHYLHQWGRPMVKEILVVDALSQDNTTAIAESKGATAISTSRKGRASQMNVGAHLAGEDILYFVHADTYPPPSYSQLILEQVNQGYSAGCFTSIFDRPHPFLRFCNYFSRFPFWFCRGGGQTLFVKKSLFHQLGGFDESMILMEEYDFIHRIRQETSFAIIKRNAVTSARDYNINGAIRLQLIYACVFFLYAIGASQDTMYDFLSKRIEKA